MQRLIAIQDLKAIAPIDFANLLVSQFQFQNSHLSQLRFRRREINDAFLQISSMQPFAAGDHDRCRRWAESSRKTLSGAFERLAVDGVTWGGQLQNNLNEPLNQVCRHSVHGLMCFDLLFSSLEKLDSRAGDSDRNSSLVQEIDLKDMLEGTIVPDMESLTKEKFGACPLIAVVSCDQRMSDSGCGTASENVKLPYGSPSLLSFVMVELMKNSLESVLNTYGVLDLDDAESDGALVSIILSSDVRTGHLSGLKLHDKGGGVSQHDSVVVSGESERVHSRFLDAFYSTSPSRNREPSYHYSRMFGVPYSGAGMGLLKSKVYLDFHNADLFIGPNTLTANGAGTTVEIRFNARG